MSYTFSVNRNEIITQAMNDAGVLGVGEQIAPEDLSFCITKLNMLVKQWQGTSDFAPGLKMWSRKRADLFLEMSKSSYALGGTGSEHWVTTGAWHTAELLASAAAAAGSITVTAAQALAIADNDRIGIILSDQSSHWTTVNGTPIATTVMLDDALPASASVGAAVYSYPATSVAVRPLSLLSVVLRDRQDVDMPMAEMLLEEYEAIPTKNDSDTIGTPNSFYYEPQLTNGVLYLNTFPSDVRGFPYLHVVYLSPIADFNASTDTPDYPQNWYRALSAQLAVDIAPGFQVPATAELVALRNDAVAIARNHDPDMTGMYFQPYLDERARSRDF